MANTKKAVNTTENTSEAIAQEVKEEVKKQDIEDTASVLDRINQSVDEVAETVTIQPKSRKTEVTIGNEEEIACKSITFGGLTWVSSRTNAHYRWANIGATEYIPFGELVTLNNTKRDFLFKPMFIVQDERVVKYFRLQEIYEEVAQIHNLKKLFDAGNLNEVAKAIDNAIAVNMRDIVISKVRDMRKTGELNNIDVIKLLEQQLCFDLSEDTAE
jgi:hypothetical protein